MEEIKRLINEPMRNHTTFRTGGPAGVLYLPKTEDEVRRLIAYCKETAVPWMVMGRGSNLLVSDKGLPGAVIKLADDFSDIHIKGDLLTAQAGASLRDIAQQSIEAGLCGLEFAGGIPGALGGGVCMNAGAYGGELKDFIRSVRALTPEGEIKDIPNEQMRFSYRSSAAQTEDMVILGATFCLPHGDTATSLKKLSDLNARRKKCQPLNYPSAGSTFKRPPGYFAGALIEQCGLMGCSVGEAMVSKKHAGFIVNTGRAASSDIYALIHHVQDEVARKTGIRLDTEIKIIGDF